MKDQHGNKITEHEFTKDIGHRTEEKTIEEMFEEYAKWVSEDCTTSLGGRIDSLYNEKKKRMPELITLITKQIQSELLKEVMKLGVPEDAKFVSKIVFTHQIKKLAEEKEIILN